MGALILQKKVDIVPGFCFLDYFLDASCYSDYKIQEKKIHLIFMYFTLH